MKSHPQAVKQFLAGIKEGEANLRYKNQTALADVGGIYPGVNPTVVQSAVWFLAATWTCWIPARKLLDRLRMGLQEALGRGDARCTGI